MEKDKMRKLAMDYADTLDDRRYDYMNFIIKAFEAGYEASNCIKHEVIKSVCQKCGNDKYFDSKNGKIQCRTCGKWFRQTVF